MKIGIITGILIALVALSTGVAAAQYGQGGAGICDNNGTCPGIVDVDGDGVCDNGGSGLNFTDEDGDGVCDYFGINGRDDDSDGIPNGQDDDYVRPQDGNGQKEGRNK